MTDQAETLRRLMQSRKNAGESSLPPVVVAFSPESNETSEASHICLSLATDLARSGSSILVVQFGSDNEASLSQITECEPGLWLCTLGLHLDELLAKPVALKRELLRSLLDVEPLVDLVLVDLTQSDERSRQGWLSRVHGEGPLSHAQGVVFLTPDHCDTRTGSLEGVVKVLEEFQGSRALKGISVIVNQVTDAEKARVLYSHLRQGLGPFLSSSVEYLGHFPKDEKFAEAMRNGKNLLDWNYRRNRHFDSAVASLELLSKRVRMKFLKMEESEIVEAGRKLRAGKFGPVARFKDEPAHKAPGNTAKFWKTLLGEVEA